MIICTFCRSAQNHPIASFRSDLATTLARLGVNFGQQRPNTNWLQLRPDLAPRWRPFGSKFAPSWCPYGFKMGDMTGPIRNPQDARFHYVVFSCHVFSTFLLLSMMLPMLCLRWAQLFVKPSPKVPSYGMLELTWTMCITRLQLGVRLDRFGSNFSPT